MKPQWSLKDFADKYGFDAKDVRATLGGAGDKPRQSHKESHWRGTKFNSVNFNGRSTYDHDEMLAWLKKHGFVK